MHALPTFLAFVLASAFLLAPSFAQSESVNGCQLDGNQLELNECAYAKFMKADAEMNRLYAEQMSHVSADNKKRLLASQRAWLVYLDAACHYEIGPREESGSIWPMQNWLCRESLTRQRGQVFKAYVACRVGGCPQ